MSEEPVREILRVARIVMPEKGLFLVRCPSPPPAYGAQVLGRLASAGLPARAREAAGG